MAVVDSRRAMTIGQQLLASTDFLIAILDGLDDEDWRRQVPTDGRTVGVVARHVADSLPVCVGIARSVSEGGKLPTWEAIHEWNAQMAKTNAGCRQAETISALREAAAASAESIKQFTDDELEVTTVNHENQTRSVADILHTLLVGHTLHHAGDIQKALTDRRDPPVAPVGTPHKERTSMVRLVVTGETEQGNSVFVSDRKVESVTVAAMPNAEFYRLWGSDEPVALPTAGDPPSFRNLFPPANGFRFAVLRLGPDQTAMPPDFDSKAAMAELSEKLPGAPETMDFEHPGMHQTNTVDFGVVVSGEIWIELDNGEEVHLRAGDFLIQNGTRHAWRNKSSGTCTLAFALLGANRRT